MIKLFRYENFNVTISEEALLLKPFSIIWKRDRSKNKEVALLELGYVYFMCDPRSDYQHYLDEEERSNEIIAGEGLGEWKPDIKVKEAMDFYRSFKTTSAVLLEDSKAAIDKLRKYLKDIDFTVMDDKGRPLYPINTIASTIKMIPTLIKDLSNIEELVAKEIVESGKMRGSGEKTIFDDGF